MTGAGATTGLIIIALSAAIVAGVWFGWRWYRNPERALERQLQPLARDMLSHVFIPDGLGGEIYLNRLLLTSAGLLLLDIQDHRGTVFAGDQLNTWTAQQPANRVTFDNPLHQLRERATAVAMIAPDIPLQMAVVFPNDTVFTKGRPESVMTLSQLSDWGARAVNPSEHPAPPDWMPQWQQLRAVAKVS